MVDEVWDNTKGALCLHKSHTINEMGSGKKYTKHKSPWSQFIFSPLHAWYWEHCLDHNRQQINTCHEAKWINERTKNKQASLGRTKVQFWMCCLMYLCIIEAGTVNMDSRAKWRSCSQQHKNNNAHSQKLSESSEKGITDWFLGTHKRSQCEKLRRDD